MDQSPGPESHAIRCQELRKRFGDVEALCSLDLEIPAGSIFGFLGRNGAGKTTTMRLMTGLAHPTSGTAWVNGIETTRADSSAREQFGYLPQDPTFYTWMTPLDYLDYVARLFGLNRQDRKDRIASILAQLGLDKAANRKIAGFSGGMIQRLGIAQALIHRPPVLFLDEPTSSLDPAGRYDVLQLIESLRGRITVFLSSHILGDIERVCDQIGIIHEGKLLLVAGRDELLARYATNVVSLEIEYGNDVALETFLADLREQSWVSTFTASGGRLRIDVHESGIAKQALLPLIVKHGLVIRSYAWERPSLEEVFLRISE